MGNIKEKFQAFFTKHASVLAKEGIKLEGIEAPVELKVMGKLADGTEVRANVDELAEGVDVFVVDAEGNEIPAPDGDHTFEDGSTITVVAGKITAIKAFEEEIDMSAEDLEKNLNILGETLSAVTAERDTLKTELEALKAGKTAMESEVAKLKADVAKLSKQPAVTSVKKKGEGTPAAPQKQKAWSQMTIQERMIASRLNSSN